MRYSNSRPPRAMQYRNQRARPPMWQASSWQSSCERHQRIAYVCAHVCAHPHNNHVTQATINMLQSKVDSMMILQTEQEEQHKAILALKTTNNGKITVLTDLKSLLALKSI